MSEWQPIETAPKDGTEVLLWTPEGIDIGRYEKAEDDAPDFMGHDDGWISLGCRTTLWGRSFGVPEYYRNPQNEPTHWMPLPPPPERIDNDNR